jgi:hypothetical protein
VRGADLSILREKKLNDKKHLCCGLAVGRE